MASEDDDFVMVEAKELRPVSELQAWLEPTDYLSPGNEYMKHIRSHVQGTGQQIRRSRIFEAWKSVNGAVDHGSNCLWIKGVPGSGKSVFSAATAEELQREGNVVVFFFFRQIVATNHDPKYLVRDWLAQLLPHSAWLHAKLDGLSKSRRSDDELWEILVQALHKMETPVYCIADGLDEMDDQHTDFITKLKELGTDGQNKNLKLLLASRPIPRIEDTLRDNDIASMKLEPATLYEDINRYVEVRLDSLQPRLSQEKYQEVKVAICDRAKGLFLHARLMTDNLTNGLQEGTIVEETLPTSLERLPPNLKALYTDMLAEHSRRSGVTQEQQYTILQFVVHSSRPLRLIELGSLVAMIQEHSGMTLKEGKELVKRSCGRLLEILEDESVSVIHHSFTEFLRDGERASEDGAFPVLDKDNAHGMLVVMSLKYLDKCIVPEGALNDYVEKNEDYMQEYDDFDSRDGRSREDKRKENIIQQLRVSYPLLEYVSKNLDHHLSEVKSEDTIVLDVLDELFQPERAAFAIWLLVQWKSYRVGNITSLHVASCQGWYAYVEHYVKGSRPIDQKDAEERTPLSYTAGAGHADVVDLLLRHHADPDSDDREGLKPLHYAASNGKVEASKHLLAHGVSPLTEKTKDTPENILEQFGSDKGETPFQYACQRSHTEVIRIFLPLVDSTWKQKAFGWARNVEQIDLVLATGEVEVDRIMGVSTRLFSAAFSFNVDIVRVLLEHGANPNARNLIKRNHIGDAHEKRYSSKEWSDSMGPTAMHAWAGYTHWGTTYDSEGRSDKCFKLLMDAGGDIHARDGDGWTPLHCACKKPENDLFGGSFGKYKDSLVSALLKAGADPNARCNEGVPLQITQRKNVIEMLVTHGADINSKDDQGRSLLIAQLQPWLTNDVPAIKKLLELGADPSTKDDKGNTALHWLMRCFPKLAEPDLVQAFIDKGVDVAAPNIAGNPAFLCIDENGNNTNRWSFDEKGRATYQKIFNILCEAGMDMNTTGLDGFTILHKMLTSYNQNVETLEFLIESGCSPLVRDHAGATMLHRCMGRSLSDCNKLVDLLVRRGVDPLSVSHAGNNLVHELVFSEDSYYSFKQKIIKLRDFGVATDARNHDGQTPLHIACGNNSTQMDSIIEVLLDNEIVARGDVNASDHDGARPIHYAAITSERNVKLLLDHGADPEVLTYEGVSPLHLAARTGQANIVGVLLQEYRNRGSLKRMVSLKHGEYQRHTALHHACIVGRPEIVQYLLEAGADANSTTYQGLTPLHVLADKQENVAPRYTSRDKLGRRVFAFKLSDGDIRTASIDTLAKHRTDDIVEILSRAGADMHHQVDDGKHPYADGIHTPVDYAVSKGCSELVIAFRKRGIHASNVLLEGILSDQSRSSVDIKMFMEADKEHSVARGTTSGTGRLPVTSTAEEKVMAVFKTHNYDLLRAMARHSKQFLVETAHALARWGRVFLLEEILEGIEDVDAYTTRISDDNECMTLLGQACESKLPNMEVIRFLVEKAKVDINRPFQSRWLTHSALHVLAQGNVFWHIEAISYLVSHGAKLNEREEAEDESGRFGDTPLTIAVASKSKVWSYRIATILLENGADANKANNEGNTPLDLADSAEMVTALAKHGADIKDSRPLLKAIQGLRVATVKALLEAGIDPNKLGMVFSRELRYPLHKAACPSSRMKKDSFGGNKCKDIVDTLLAYGADPMAHYEDGTTIIQKAVEKHGLHDSLIKNADIDINRKGKGGRSLLISSCLPLKKQASWQKNKSEVPVRASINLAMTLINKGADINARDDDERTALHVLCTSPTEFNDKEREVFTALATKSPESMHAFDSQGQTPFHLAIRSNQQWATEQLLARGVDPTVLDRDGNNVLHLLSPKLFAKKAAAALSSEVFKQYVALGVPINTRNKDGETPLSIFIQQSHHATLDRYGESYMHEFDLKKITAHTEMLPLFVEAGADLFTVNDKGEGLLHLTAGRRWNEMNVWQDQAKEVQNTFQELLKLGLDPRLEDAECRTAIDVAVATGHSGIVDLFREEKKGAVSSDSEDGSGEDIESEESDSSDGSSSSGLW
ncbi:unnamed protein product [Periconia digitata]|uniref:Nephrocystin 3-like N-terminal domain-containing protein n=1 Tax=Periconia digitata TaxID=1303443 RepID=A0A9W4U7Q9_9PLEO|nr:unnamed protein product [Periconia digitata]